MRKDYIMPQMEVVEMTMGRQLLAGSTPGYGGGSDLTPESPRNNHFDYSEEI